MFKQLKTIVAGVALAAASAASSAAVWTQTLDPNPDIYIGPDYTLNFNLTTAGFNPSDDTITGFTFTVTTYDDERRDGAEWVFADLPGLLADGLFFSTGTSSTGTSLLGAFSLNVNGMLSAVISSPVGDFMLDSATLRATGIDRGNNVPEPATLALVGLALAGIGAQRKIAAKK